MNPKRTGRTVATALIALATLLVVEPCGHGAKPGPAGTCSYGFLLNWRSVIRGSIAAELSTFWE